MNKSIIVKKAIMKIHYSELIEDVMSYVKRHKIVLSSLRYTNNGNVELHLYDENSVDYKIGFRQDKNLEEYLITEINKYVFS